MKKATSTSILKKIQDIHGDTLDLSLFHYQNMRTKVSVICPSHGIFTPTPHSLLKGCGCKQCGVERRATKKTQAFRQTFVDKAQKQHDHFYSYAKTVIVNAKQKVLITCPAHGDFLQLPTDHLKGHGCKQCATDANSIRYADNNNDFIVKAIQIHGNNYDYSKTNYKRSKNKIIITCPNHGDFKQVPNSHLSGYGCPVCGKVKSAGETEIADFLGKYTSVETRQRTIIPPKEIDIYLPEHRLAIEFNGLYWHSESTRNDAKTIHQDKHITCRQKDIRLIQIWEDDWNNKQSLIQSMLLHAIGKTTTIYARHCQAERMNGQEAKAFFITNHLNGFRPSQHYFGLRYNGNLVMALSVGRLSVSINKVGLEITRMATLAGFSVVGGVSKLMTFVDTQVDYHSLITFADALWYDGSGYLSAGFIPQGLTPPGYCYTNRYGRNRYHRYQFAKHKLKDKLTHYDENMSEVKNMHANGYVRLWDAGHYKFIKEGGG